MQWLTVIVFDEAGFEAFQFVAGDDCLRLNINIALKSARNWNWKARLLLFLKGSLNFSHPLSDALDIVQRELGNFFPPLFPPLPLHSY